MKKLFGQLLVPPALSVLALKILFADWWDSVGMRSRWSVWILLSVSQRFTPGFRQAGSQGGSASIDDLSVLAGGNRKTVGSRQTAVFYAYPQDGGDVAGAGDRESI